MEARYSTADDQITDVKRGIVVLTANAGLAYDVLEIKVLVENSK